MIFRSLAPRGAGHPRFRDLRHGAIPGEPGWSEVRAGVLEACTWRWCARQGVGGHLASYIPNRSRGDIDTHPRAADQGGGCRVRAGLMHRSGMLLGRLAIAVAPSGAGLWQRPTGGACLGRDIACLRSAPVLARSVILGSTACRLSDRVVVTPQPARAQNRRFVPRGVKVRDEASPPPGATPMAASAGVRILSAADAFGIVLEQSRRAPMLARAIHPRRFVRGIPKSQPLPAAGPAVSRHASLLALVAKHGHGITPAGLTARRIDGLERLTGRARVERRGR